MEIYSQPNTNTVASVKERSSQHIY